jgi:hypothetical protein
LRALRDLLNRQFHSQAAIFEVANFIPRFSDGAIINAKFDLHFAGRPMGFDRFENLLPQLRRKSSAAPTRFQTRSAKFFAQGQDDARANGNTSQNGVLRPTGFEHPDDFHGQFPRHRAPITPVMQFQSSWALYVFREMQAQQIKFSQARGTFRGEPNQLSDRFDGFSVL